MHEYTHLWGLMIVHQILSLTFSLQTLVECISEAEGQPPPGSGGGGTQAEGTNLSTTPAGVRCPTQHLRRQKIFSSFEDLRKQVEGV